MEKTGYNWLERKNTCEVIIVKKSFIIVYLTCLSLPGIQANIQKSPGNIYQDLKRYPKNARFRT